MNASLWFWIALAVLLAIAGLRRWRAVRDLRQDGRRIDDDSIRRIVDQGQLHLPDHDAPLDEDEIARAEAEFWAESWDEPEDFTR